MNQTDPTEFLLSLEHSVWQALVKGDVATDERLLSDEFRGVYSSGLADKAAHVGQLKNGPTVLEYELTNPQTLLLADGVFALTYLARWTRAPKTDTSAREAMYVTSIWRRERQVWVNVFSQDTGCGPGQGASSAI